MVITPFDDKGESTSVGGLTIENGEDRIAIYGQFAITRDQQGLKNAQVLKVWLDAIVAALEGEPHLPEKAPGGEHSHPVDNPF